MQLSEATAPIPLPPMVSMYDAEPPAPTTAVLEPPGGTPSPRLELIPCPDKFTVCGEPDASSTIERTPVRLPKAVGRKMTEIWHDGVGLDGLLPTESPQLFVSEKSPETEILEIVSGQLPLFVKVTT